VLVVVALFCCQVEIYRVNASVILDALPLLLSHSASFLVTISITMSFIQPIHAFNPETAYAHDMKKQKLAIKAWSKILSEKDYNASEWARSAASFALYIPFMFVVNDLLFFLKQNNAHTTTEFL